MSSIGSNWFTSIRSNDSENEIDGSLTSELDNSFLGFDIANNGFNIGESLLMSLPLCKTEGSNRSSCAKRKVCERNGNCSVQLLDGTAITENTSPTILTNPRGHYLPNNSPVEDRGHMISLVGCNDSYGLLTAGCSQFQYILMAPTSPATKLNEETQTYLNQGHPYEIKMKKIESNSDCDGQLYQSIVRVVFHERRLQYLEREQLENWKLTRPGERLVDIEIPLSNGLVDAWINPQELNCVGFLWDPHRDTSICVKIHCISTEFTAKKHGGEKGVPFRLQVETYRHNNRGPETILHCSSCQIKVFKPKGADRKLKTDREKIEKKTDAEREKFQPAFEYTVMTDVPLDQVSFYLDHLSKKSEEKVHPAKLPLPPIQLRPQQPLQSNHGGLSYGSPTQFSPFTVDPSPCRNALHPEEMIAHSQSSVVPPGDCGQNLVDSSSFDATRSPGTPSSTNSSMSNNSSINSGSPLPLSASEAEAAAWLTANRFNNLIKIFRNFSGADILRLTRSDMIELCGLSDGIRLNNTVMARNVPPFCTIYVSPKSENVNRADHEHILAESQNAIQSSTSSRLLSSKGQGTEMGPGLGTNHTVQNLNSKNKVSLASGTLKRPLTSNDEDDPDRDGLSSNKRHCIRNSENTYYAVYLHCATSQHLLEQLACVLNLSVQLIQYVQMLTPSGILVRITDTVVQNLMNESKFFSEVIADDSNLGLYHLLLTPSHGS